MKLDDPKAWFDNWHLHFDWQGYGDKSFKRRQPHLDKLFRHFELLQKETEKLKLDFQLYAILFDYESYYDALFLNTPNPNNDIFPWTPSNLSTTSNLTNENLLGYIDELNGFDKLYGRGEQPFCLLYKSGIGCPFKPTAAAEI